MTTQDPGETRFLLHDISYTKCRLLIIQKADAVFQGECTKIPAGGGGGGTYLEKTESMMVPKTTQYAYTTNNINNNNGNKK